MNGKHLIEFGLLAVVILVALLVFLSKHSDTAGTDVPILVYCAAGIKPPVLQLAQDFDPRPVATLQVIQFLFGKGEDMTDMLVHQPIISFDGPHLL